MSKLVTQRENIKVARENRHITCRSVISTKDEFSAELEARRPRGSMCKIGRGGNPLRLKVCIQLDEQPREAAKEPPNSFSSHFPPVHSIYKQPKGSWQDSFGNVGLGY